MGVKKGLASPGRLVAGMLLVMAIAVTSACGTLDIGVEEANATVTIPAPTAMPAPTELARPTAEETTGPTTPAVAWYGTVHSVPGDDDENDYLKPWHLAIWPKFGRAVGLDGADPAVRAEIERLRDQDIKATFWGDLTCNVADYGTCRLLVERISASDGGPHYEPDRVEGWEGHIGRLPVQPGSQNDLLYFVLDGPVTALYGIAGADSVTQDELHQLAETESQTGDGAVIRIWGDLLNKAQHLTGTRIDVERIEIVAP